MRKIKYLIIVSFIFIITACAPGYMSNDNFKKRFGNSNKITATIIKPDAHVITIDGNKTRELSIKSQVASRNIERSLRANLPKKIYVTGTTGTTCPYIQNDNGLDDNSCSLLIKSLREAYEKATKYPKYAGGKSLKGLYLYKGYLPSTNISIYTLAIEPTRSAGELTKDVLISVVVGALTGIMPSKSYTDKIVMIVVDNKTKEILWLSSVAGDIDLEDQKEVDEKIKELSESLKKYIDSK
jgi:hypothetical protein